MRFLPSIFIAVCVALMASPHASAASAGGTSAGATDPNYILAVGDTIGIGVIEEPELGTTQLIDRTGLVRVQLIGDLNLAGKSVRAAEELIATTYKEQEYLRDPQVRIIVVEYALREVSVLGAVKSPGKIAFPRDTQTMEIVDVITQSGGLASTGRGDSVSVTRIQENGKELTLTVDVSSLISGRRRNDEKPKNFLVYPGDRIFVPERLF